MSKDSGVLLEMYKDAFSPSFQQFGSMLVNLIKCARGAYFRGIDEGAARQDQFQNHLRRLSEKLPEKESLNLQLIPEIVGKSFENMRYLEDENILTEMFLNLIASSLDKNKVSTAHPAFPHIISNLSRDEAIIIFLLNKQNYKVTQYSKLDNKKNVFWGREVVSNDFPLEKLDFPNNFFMYIDHLYTLNIAGMWQNGNQIPDIKDNEQVGVSINSVISLKDFGKLFAKACVVDDVSKFGISI